MNQTYISRHYDLERANKWIAEQVNRIYDVEIGTVKKKDLRGNEYDETVVYYEEREKKVSEYFPRDAMLCRYSKLGY